MSAHDVALRMIRQRGTTCADPEFIAAYLAHELWTAAPVTTYQEMP